MRSVIVALVSVGFAAAMLATPASAAIRTALALYVPRPTSPGRRYFSGSRSSRRK